MINLFSQCTDTAHKFSDSRGYLEVLHESSMCVLKRSYSKKGVFRGMHWQKPPKMQTKIIRVVTGKIADFVVPMMATDKVIHHKIIVPDDGWIRIGPDCAHGLYALEDTLFEYFCDGGYSEADEVGFTITGHIRTVLGVDDVLLSAKDMRAPDFATIV